MEPDGYKLVIITHIVLVEVIVVQILAVLRAPVLCFGTNWGLNFLFKFWISEEDLVVRSILFGFGRAVKLGGLLLNRIVAKQNLGVVSKVLRWMTLANNIQRLLGVT